MTGEIIKQFLVGLGFGVDDASLAKFNKAIASAGLRVAALYGSIKIAAAGIFWSISKISEGFEQMGYEYRIIAPAINKALLLRRELLAAYRAAGINIVKAVQESVKFNFSLAKTKFALEAIYKSVGLKFLPMLTKQMDIFRTKIYANMPKIQNWLERFVKFIFKAFEATTILGGRVWSILGRVYDLLVELDKATGGWSTRILAFAAAWYVLNLEFLATPLGMLLTGLLAILALYDDFMTWKEGGESLFDWTKFLPVIDQVKNAVAGVVGIFTNLGDAIAGVVFAIGELFSGNFSSAFDALKQVGSDILGIFTSIWKVISGLAGATGIIGNLIGDKLPSVFGGGGAANTVNNMAQPAPLMPGGGSNQNVNQQTQITVMGSADANATGKAVAGEQGRVNADLTRNLRGAAQ